MHILPYCIGLHVGGCIIALWVLEIQRRRIFRESTRGLLHIGAEIVRIRLLVFSELLVGWHFTFVMVAGAYQQDGLTPTATSGDRGASLALILLALPLPALISEFFCLLFWPVVGYLRFYREYTADSEKPLSNFELWLDGIVRWQNTRQSPITVGLRWFVRWISVYLVLSARLWHYKVTKKKMTESRAVDVFECQGLADLLLAGTVWSIIFLLIIGFIASTIESFLLQIFFVSAFFISFLSLMAACVYVIYNCQRRFDLEETISSAYIEKERAAVTRSHGGVIAPEIIHKSPTDNTNDRISKPSQKLVMYRRRFQLVSLSCVAATLSVTAATVLGQTNVLPGFLGALIMTSGTGMLASIAFWRANQEGLQLWENLGLTLGALVPLHHARQIGHLLANSLAAPGYALKLAEQFLAPETVTEELRPLRDEVFEQTRLARESVEYLYRWASETRATAKEVQSLLRVTPAQHGWIMLDDLVRQIRLNIAATVRQHSTRVARRPRIRVGFDAKDCSMPELQTNTVIEQRLGRVALALDRVRFVDVINILVRNACEALDVDGSRDMGVHTALAVRPPKIGVTLELDESAFDPIRFKIWDNGPGIPPDIRQMLFEPYVTTKTDGTGIGLFMSREYLRSIGGRITFTTSASPGTSFTQFALSLPWTCVRFGAGSIEKPLDPQAAAGQ